MDYLIDRIANDFFRPRNKVLYGINIRCYKFVEKFFLYYKSYMPDLTGVLKTKIEQLIH